MEFRIEATKPTSPADLKSVLDAALQSWLENTPQESDSEARGWMEKVDDARASGGKPDAVAKMIRDNMDGFRACVKRNAGKLDAAHAGCMKLAQAGIESALLAVTGHGDAKVRVSIVGHFDVSEDGIAIRPSSRLVVHTDIAE